MVPEFGSERFQGRLLDDLESLSRDVYADPAELAALLECIEEYPDLDPRPLRAGTDSVPFVAYKRTIFNLLDDRLPQDAVGIAGCHGVSFGDHLQIFGRSVICLDARSINFSKVQEIIQREWDDPFCSAECWPGTQDFVQDLVKKYLFGKRVYGAAGGFLFTIAEKVKDGLERLFVLELRGAGVCFDDIQSVDSWNRGGQVNFRWTPWRKEKRDLFIRYPGPIDITKPEQYQEILHQEDPAFFFVKAGGGVTMKWPFLSAIAKHVQILVTNDYCTDPGTRSVIIRNDPGPALQSSGRFFQKMTSPGKQHCERFIQDPSWSSVLAPRLHIIGGENAQRYPWRLEIRERCGMPVDCISERCAYQRITG